MAVKYHRMAPGDNAVNPITIPGTNRTYSAATGSFAVVPNFDRQVLGTAGWVALHGSIV